MTPMILNKFGMVFLFLTAYIPLFIVMSIKIFKLDNFPLLIILIFALISEISIFIINEVFKRLEKKIDPTDTNIKINETKNRDYIIFIITYLVPFFGISTDFNTLIALFVLFVFIGYIYINTSLFAINPTLMLIWKYNLYNGVIKGENVIIISKLQLKSGLHTLKLINLSKDVYMGVKYE